MVVVVVVRGMGEEEREMGEKGRDVSQHWGPMRGCRRWRAVGEGVERLQAATGGTGWARLAKEHSTPVCGHAWRGGGGGGRGLKWAGFTGMSFS